MKTKLQFIFPTLITLLIISSFGLSFVAPAASGTAATITVSATQWGTSSNYIGADEGSSGFSIADFQDAGINSYRIYGGMSAWEPQDDDGVYGSPSIATIKANVNSINWAWWDNVMAGQPHYT